MDHQISNKENPSFVPGAGCASVKPLNICAFPKTSETRPGKQGYRIFLLSALGGVFLMTAMPIPKGRGGFPRILSLAAKRAKAWHFHPKNCPPLQSHPGRQTRSECREACQIVLETILRHLDLTSMSLGTPTLANASLTSTCAPLCMIPASVSAAASAP